MKNMNPDLLVIDCEASGLYDGSYPITLGVCGPDEQTWFWMICPMEDWDHWDSYAEAIHGVERDQLVAQGRDAFLVAREMNAVFMGQVLYCDSAWDQAWVRKLFDDSGVRMAFEIRMLSSACTPGEYTLYEEWVEYQSMSHHPVQDAKKIRKFIMANFAPS